jgi:transcriptional regulator with XRE-family HTH domain
VEFVRKQLIEARENKKITREKLAKMLNISYSMVDKVEKGIRNPSIKLTKKWAFILGINEIDIMEYFFTLRKDNMSQVKTCFATGTES